MYLNASVYEFSECMLLCLSVCVHVFESAQHKRIVYVYCLTAFHSQTRNFLIKRYICMEREREREAEWEANEAVQSEGRSYISFIVFSMLPSDAVCSFVRSLARLLACSLARLFAGSFVCLLFESRRRDAARCSSLSRRSLRTSRLFIYLSFGLFCMPFCVLLFVSTLLKD